MWFIGLLIGMLIGSVYRIGEGTIWGGMLGALVGALISFSRGQSRPSEIEARLAALEFAVRKLQEKIGRSPIAVAAAPPEQAMVPGALAVPPDFPRPAEDEIPDWEAQPADAQTPVDHPEPEGLTAGPVPSQPAEPFLFGRAWAWLTGGNALVRVGVVVLFFGVAFLLKYAYEHSHVPIEVRLIGVALGAAVMLAIGWRLREAKPVYALAMQGGGVGLLYLTVFGAFRLFSLIPGEAAFFLLVAIAVFSAVLAVLQNAMSLAVLGVSGGFLAPVLAHRPAAAVT